MISLDSLTISERVGEIIDHESGHMVYHSAIDTINLQEDSDALWSYLGFNEDYISQSIQKYNELANGAWSKHNLILVSVNPVNEAIEAQHGYHTKNVNIISFNNQLKAGTSGKANIKYCDTYNLINGNFQTGDGLHYSGGTYKDIYNGMMGCVR